MKKYADYDFYINEYRGKMHLELFEEAIIPATAYIKRATLGRSERSDKEEIKYAACAVCEAYNAVYKSGEESTGKTIKSENTDGYSITYAQEFADGTNKENAFRSKASKLVSLYLDGTGLLNARVGVMR